MSGRQPHQQLVGLVVRAGIEKCFAPCQVSAAATRHDPFLRKVDRAGQERNRVELDRDCHRGFSGHPAQVPHEPESCHVRTPGRAAVGRDARAHVVQPGHRIHRRTCDLHGCDAGLDGRGDHPDAQGFGENDVLAGPLPVPRTDHQVGRASLRDRPMVRERWTARADLEI